MNATFIVLVKVVTGFKPFLFLFYFYECFYLWTAEQFCPKLRSEGSVWCVRPEQSFTHRLLFWLYKSINRLILLNCSPSFFSVLTASNKSKQNCIRSTASRVISPLSPNLSDLENRAITALSIANDTDHPLRAHFTLPPSGRTWRTGRWQRASFGRSLVLSALADLRKAPR